LASPLSPGGCHAPATLWRAHSSSSPSNVFPLWVPAPHWWERPRRAKFLQRFRELYFEIEEFLLIDEHAEYNQLRDDQWLLDFVFLTDLLSGLHFELRGKDRTVVRVIRSVHALKWLMRHLSWKLQTQRKACACRGRTNAFKTTLLYFEPAATFIDVEDESLATLFHLNSPLERTFRCYSPAEVQGPWTVLDLITEGKSLNMRKCAPFLHFLALLFRVSQHFPTWRILSSNTVPPWLMVKSAWGWPAATVHTMHAWLIQFSHQTKGMAKNVQHCIVCMHSTYIKNRYLTFCMLVDHIKSSSEAEKVWDGNVSLPSLCLFTSKY